MQECIESWEKHLPEFTIKEWNEDCFDINCTAYVRQAYERKKYAFVSDYVRFWVLYRYGGLYFDTDVEVIKAFGSLLDDEAFAGLETEEFVAPGLVLWCKEKGNEILEEILELYNNTIFIKDDKTLNTLTVCVYFTQVLQKHGFVPGNVKQKCGTFTIYPIDYFCPFDDLTGLLKTTKNTVSIHWYQKSWMSNKQKLSNRVSRVLHRIFGVHFFWDLKQKLKRYGAGA